MFTDEIPPVREQPAVQAPPAAEPPRPVAPSVFEPSQPVAPSVFEPSQPVAPSVFEPSQPVAPSVFEPRQPVRAPQPAKVVKPARPAKSPKPVRPAKAAQPAKSPEAVQAPVRPAPPRAGTGKTPRRRRPLTVGLFALALVVVASAAAAITMVVRGGNSPSGGVSGAVLQSQQTAARENAAAWVANHVRTDATVSCDAAMCAAIRASGFPAGKLHTLGTASAYPLTSDIVVETLAVSSLLGHGFAAHYAPGVLAAFSGGNMTISIRVIAPHGAAAYRQALAADLAARTSSGAALLQSGAGDITVSPLAQKQLTAGRADSRLLIALASLAADLPIDIIQFGNIAPGASPDAPLRFADLSTTDPADHTDSPAYVQSLLGHLNTGPGAHPASMYTGVLPGDQSVLRVEFFAPSPLGLLGP